MNPQISNRVRFLIEDAKHPVALPHGMEVPHPHNFIYAVAIKSGCSPAASGTIMRVGISVEPLPRLVGFCEFQSLFSLFVAGGDR